MLRQFTQLHCVPYRKRSPRIVQATDSRADALPPLPGAKRKYSVESQYKIVNGRMLGEVGLLCVFRSACRQTMFHVLCAYLCSGCVAAAQLCV